MATTLLVVKNRAYSKLAAAITAGATSLTVTAGEGANFPDTYPFHLTIDDEIVSCTNRSTDTLTIVRAQQSTTAATHSNKSYVALNITAKSITDLNTAVNTIEATVVSAEIVLLDDKRIIFGTGSDISMKWDGTDFHLDVAGSTAQLNIGATSHLAYVKLAGSLAITEAELSVNMAKGDPAASFTNTSTGLGLRVNREATSVGNILEVQRAGVNVFYIEGDTARARFANHLKAMAGFVVEAGAVVFGETGGGDVTFHSGDTPNYRVYFDHDADSNRGQWNFGKDDYGIDVKFWGNTTGKYMLWDASADKLVLACELNAAGNMLDNLYTLRSRAGDNVLTILARKAFANQGIAFYLQTYNASNVATSRLTLTGGYNTAVATWADVTHTGFTASGLVTSTSDRGFDFTGTLVPDASRLDYAYSMGNRVAELTVNLANAASQNLEVFQANINLTASGGAPTSTSTVSLVRVRSTHDTVDMPNLRLRNINSYMDVRKNLQDAYGVIHGVDFYTNAVAVGGEAAVGVFNMEANSAVTGNVRGIIINVYGAGLPSTTSIGLEVRTDGGAATLGEGIRVWSVGSCSINYGLYIDGTINTADIRFHHGTTLLDDGTDLTLAGANLKMSGNNLDDVGIIYGNSTYLRIGDATTTQNSLASEDDLMVTGKFEVIGSTYFGYNTAGVDLKIFGDITGSYLLWDASEEGLIIHQGATDTPFLFVRSSDVATGLTTGVLGSDVTTNDWLSIEKSADDYGGVWIQAMMEDGAYSATPIFLVSAYGSQADTTKSTSGRALIEFYAAEHNGSNTLAAVTADGNIFGIRGHTVNTVLLVDEDGDLWMSGGLATGGATVKNYTQNLFGGAFLSGGGSSAAYKQRTEGALTGVAGDTTYLSGTVLVNTITTQSASESIAYIAQLVLFEPNITDYLTGDITIASTLYINNAPTEGETNAAIYVASGKILIASADPIQLGVAGSTTGTLDICGATSGVVTVTVNATAGTWTMTLPAAVGTAGHQLTDAGGNGITSWAAPSSLREYKDILCEANPQEALDAILRTKAYRFHYKEGMGTLDIETEYVGVLANEALWAMHYGGAVVNPVNTLGYMVLGFQAMDAKIETVKEKIERLESEVAELKGALC